MKKNLLWMMAAILTCGFAFTSCDKDDEEPEIPETPAAVVKAVNIDYKIKISDATKESIKKAITFSVEYYDQMGNLIQSEPLKYGNSEWAYGFSMIKFPGNYGFKVTAAPKADLSAVGDDDAFDIIYDVLVTGTPMDAEGKAIEGGRELKTTVKYPAMDIKAVAADKEKFEDSFFFTVDANGNITAKK